MLHFVMSYMKQNKSRKQTLEIAQYGLEISFNHSSLEHTGMARSKRQIAISVGRFPVDGDG